MSDYATRKQDYKRIWNTRCYRTGCDKEVHYEKGTYFTLCRTCLKNLKLGPYYRSKHKNDYESLFWNIDQQKQEAKRRNIAI